MPQDDIESARAEHADELMALPNVVGVGIGRRGDQPVIKVFVQRKIPVRRSRRTRSCPPPSAAGRRT